ncbi:Glucose-resistance amylase regulator [Tritonibacter multivorans]|uniref:Glucose-resistance amylase regulator n=1 Tax=Tritonibacter multivorans TaxID=928856 RepID=A0A0P1GJ18_9RHOB|nr:LacI family DNA-binding transcriptional regulator [Tritonibacter multivorans]MDA7420312.1 LacI family DNA-binding transcriptional regulator [Tritonibacter multivorans]CUH81840.1 Glucose-resistance amylase regulator [Tritonibacter multivorans]SFC44897.1 DNA-binding transcriptional regulator, LacI/PurR family [Tritonibacter multivorans]
MTDENNIPAKPRRRVTAKAVAERAGVSRSAVSRAFTKGAYLDQEKKARILEVAEELGYRPNVFAASLQAESTNIVAVLTGNMKSHFDTELVEELLGRLTAEGKWPIVVNGEKVANASSIEGLFGFPVDAMILRGGSMDKYVVESCAKLHIPLIVSGVTVKSERVDSVACRNADGTYALTQLLLEKGRRRFAWIDGPTRVVTQEAHRRERRQGVERALAERGLEIIATRDSDYTYEGGLAAAEAILREQDVDALLCANDAMAAGALSYVRENLGLKVPEDLAVTGFDDIDMASWPCFNLTTVQNPKSEIVDHIIRLLHERLANPAKAGEVVLVGADLVPRGTH